MDSPRHCVAQAADLMATLATTRRALWGEWEGMIAQGPLSEPTAAFYAKHVEHDAALVALLQKLRQVCYQVDNSSRFLLDVFDTETGALSSTEQNASGYPCL